MRNSQRDTPSAGKKLKVDWDQPFFREDFHTRRGPKGPPFTFPFQVLTGLCGRSNQRSTSYAMTYFALWGAPRHLWRMGAPRQARSLLPLTLSPEAASAVGNGQVEGKAPPVSPHSTWNSSTHSLGISTGSGPGSPESGPRNPFRTRTLKPRRGQEGQSGWS